MTMYQPGIPTGTVNLDQDYQNIQDNFQQLNTTYGSDHVAYSIAPDNGYHKAIHFVSASTTVSNPPRNQPVAAPAAVPARGEIFSAQINDNIDTDEALYFQSGGGKVMQLTRNFVPRANARGYTFLAGGLILQWGFVSNNTPGNVGTVTFSDAPGIAFPSNCFTVLTQPYTTDAPTAQLTIPIDSITRLTFHWRFLTISNSYDGFFWTAIGN